MTEERMIRVNRLDYLHLTYGNNEDVANAAIKLLYNVQWLDLEPAPPKDWRPDCFYLETHLKQEQFACKECPFREPEAKE